MKNPPVIIKVRTNGDGDKIGSVLFWMDSSIVPPAGWVFAEGQSCCCEDKSLRKLFHVIGFNFTVKSMPRPLTAWEKFLNFIGWPRPIDYIPNPDYVKGTFNLPDFRPVERNP